MIWFIADTHFGHANVIKFCNRPFKDVEEMDRILIDQINRRVKKNDTIYFLGDVAFCGMERLKQILSQINGKKILIRGNHDRSPRKMVEAGFYEVYDTHKIRLGEEEVLLSHFPFYPISFYWSFLDNYILKFKKYADRRTLHQRILDDGESILLCGHVHDKWKVKGRQINVGVDVWNYAPVSHEKILKLIEEL